MRTPRRSVRMSMPRTIRSPSVSSALGDLLETFQRRRPVLLELAAALAISFGDSTHQVRLLQRHLRAATRRVVEGNTHHVIVLRGVVGPTQRAPMRVAQFLLRLELEDLTFVLVRLILPH